MSRKLLTKSEAREDVLNAFIWYEDKRDGLGQEFMDELDTAFGHLQRRPFAFQAVFRDYHHSPLDRFPYQVIFTADEKQVVVFRLFHTSRSPEGWQGMADA